MKPKIEDIKNAPRYYFPVEYIFPLENRTVDAFPKVNFQTGFHEQAFYEINLITRGNGYHALGDRLVEASRGDVFIIPPHHKHAFVGGEGFDCYHFLLSPAFLNRYWARLSVLPGFPLLFEIEPALRMRGGDYHQLKLRDDVLELVLHSLATIRYHVNIIGRYDAHSMLVDESSAVIAIAILCDEYSRQTAENPKDSFFINSIVAISERYNEKLNISELASIAHMSRTAYMSKFKEALGITPRQYILKERIKAAKNLLRTTDRTVSKIAEEVGFFDTSHFTKAFIAEVGEGPTKYRERKSESR